MCIRLEQKNQATPPPLLRTPGQPHAPPRQPHPTPRLSQHGLPLATQFMPDDGVFCTDFRGTKFSWTIVDRVLVVSACVQFCTCIFCPGRNAASKSIDMQKGKHSDKTVVTWHLASKSHIQATKKAHAACVEALFLSLPETRSQHSTMPRAASVSAALRASTSLPSAAQDTLKEEKQELAQQRQRMETERK